MLKVADGVTATNYTSKDFKPVSGGANYAYDVNGNQKTNSDKGISNIIYNHLNLPKEIVFTSSNRKILYDYDAEGTKVRQRVHTGSTTPSSTTNYIGEFVFNGTAIDYIIHEEGRVVYESNSPIYEYNIKDHLGNVRQVLRVPTGQGLLATMEDSNAEEEETNFTMLSESRQSGVEHNVTQGGNRVAWLNSARGRTLGPSTTLSLAAGDSINLKVFAKYEEQNSSKINKASFLATGGKDRLINDLLEFSNVTSRAGGVNAITVMNIVDIIAKDLQKKDAPEAYMGYALYDADSTLYEVGKHILSKNAANEHEVLENNLYIPQDGYMETFLVNETDENVWFDDFSILSSGSPIVQETHYDPWGLELTGLGFQASNMKVNKYLYNGKEYIEENGLRYYDFGARMLDPTIGRWMSPDPLSEKFYDMSPYVAMANNPIRYVDPNGMEFTEAAWSWVNRLIADINSRQERNNATIAEKQGQLEGGGRLSDRQANRLNRQIGKLEKNNQALEGVRGEIRTLAASNQVYDVIDDNSMSQAGTVPGTGTEVGGATFNFSNGNFEIRMPRSGGLSMFAHELKHAHQFEIGDYSVGPRINDATRWNFLYDKHDELAAYQRGRLFGGPSHSSLNSLPSIYKDVATGPTDVTNHPNISSIMGLPANQQRAVYQRIANTTLHAFRINGITYYRPR